ncbi:MAG: ATP phosphoribosyltransferase regulatory subunit [Lachnospiraceae bacterium]|nr:ATP phosphoribosyltransferase regulatory subunit [Lachnospiraceae bacterium]
MTKSRLHTPEGVRDIYGKECKNKHYLINVMSNLVKTYGYSFIETPSFEFFDIFSQEVGTTPSKDLYKFFDREGNTLVLRPDMTPSIARATSKFFDPDLKPVRLSYSGNVFINNSSYQGRLKESTQLGCEFMGDNSIDADSEMIALAVKNLQTVGLKEFQISIGHVDIFKGLMQAANLDEEAADRVKDLIVNKNFFGVEELIAEQGITGDLAKLFKMLGKMYSEPSEWRDFLDIAKGYPQIYDALEYLQDLYDILNVYDVTKYVSFELGMVSSYQYYTGILFGGYTYGSGEPILRGGRYDELLSYFGKEAPAIGFAIYIDQLLMALERQKIQIYVEEKQDVVLYSSKNLKSAVAKTEELRNSGKQATMVRVSSSEDVKKMEELYKDSNIIILSDDID